MDTRLRLDILPQPDETTCGPTCLHAVYRFYGDDVPLESIIGQIHRLENGGTLSVMLGCHALKRGYSATLYTYNLQMFDPTWFEVGMGEIREKLAAQARFKQKRRLTIASEWYLKYLDLGGKLAFEDLTPQLISRYLSRGIPVLTGLSSTYLYRAPREYGPNSDYDDIRGDPAGHFVVLTGYDAGTGKVLIADPLHPNPWFESHLYEIDMDRVICSILLGILTYDDTLLIIEPRKSGKAPPGADGRSGAATMSDRAGGGGAGTTGGGGGIIGEGGAGTPGRTRAPDAAGSGPARSLAAGGLEGRGAADGHPDRRQ